MKLKLRSTQRGDISLLDLLAIVTAVVIVGALLLPMFAKSKAHPRAVNCVIHLKQVGLAYRIWANDNQDKYPAQLSTNIGGTMEWVSSGIAYQDFVVLSNEIGAAWILACPSDRQRTRATDFASVGNSNLSYFNVPDADETLPDLWLAGDRNLATNNQALAPGLFLVATNLSFNWTSQMHSNKGNICVGDGSVQQHANYKLSQSTTNWFASSNGAPFRLLIP